MTRSGNRETYRQPTTMTRNPEQRMLRLPARHSHSQGAQSMACHDRIAVGRPVIYPLRPFLGQGGDPSPFISP
jgi:hypothetical protein